MRDNGSMRLLLCGVTALFGFALRPAAQGLAPPPRPQANSTRKIRTPPGALASRVGGALTWESDLAAALATSAETDRPVFWYVRTVARSPMDRKVEIDRYVRGGPFSWPTTIALLRNRFVCCDEVPAGDVQQRYGLRRLDFIEPGYLVLDGRGEVLLRVDRLTTFHPRWFEAPLRRLVGAPLEGFPGAAGLREAWNAYRNGELDAAVERAEAVLAGHPSDALAAEAHWLAGAALHRGNRPRAARERWRRLVDSLPEQPLAWKAALEIEGHGPFVHGFEVYVPLPGAVLASDPVAGSRAPEGVYDEADLWRRSVSFLLSLEDGEGLIRDSRYDFGGTDGLPNVHAAVTCLCGMALLCASDRLADGRLALGEAEEARLERVLGRIRTHAAEDSWLALSDRDEILWARAYAVRFLAAFARRHSGDGEAREALRRAAGALLALQPETGSWFHEYANPFATATALQALHDAERLGVDVPREAIERGLRALAGDRTAKGAFSYAHREGRAPRTSVAAAAGRMPLCELALFLHGASDGKRLLRAVEAGLEHHSAMAAVRKYDDHASRLGYGGFFFWFDMLGRTEAMAHLADSEKRAGRLAAQRELILSLPEFDGCFVDSHELGRAYGTAMALLCLDETARR